LRRRSAARTAFAASRDDGSVGPIGDLKEPSTLEAACKGVSTVVLSATAMLSKNEGDSIESVDRQGALAMVSAAERAGVRHFVYVSLAPTNIDHPLSEAKKEVETRLGKSSMLHTILQPCWFTEIWLTPMLGFDPWHGQVVLFGSGDAPVSWISLYDVARAVEDVVVRPSKSSRTMKLGGPNALSQREVVRIFEELGAPAVAKPTVVAEDTLKRDLENSSSPIGRTHAGLTLAVARGMQIDSGLATALARRPLQTVRGYAMGTMQVSKPKS